MSEEETFFNYSAQELAEGGHPQPLLDVYGAYDGPWLSGQKFPPIEYVVPGLIPQGLTYIIAGPKIGKSWFVLDLALACGAGSNFLGFPIKPRPVLYMALEDGPRRIQERGNLLGVTDFPAQCLFIHRVKPVDALSVMREFMAQHDGEHPLVILDTLGKVKPPKAPGQDSYDHDYRVSESLKEVADTFGGAVIVVHHNRKADSEDFLESVSGTQGIAGAADTIIVLRRKRSETEGQLHMTSRDAEEGSFAVDFNDGKWSLTGDSLADATRALGAREAKNRLDEDSLAIIDLVNEREHEGLATTPGDVAALLDWEKKKAGTYLARLAEHHIRRRGRGIYGALTSGGVVTGVSVENQESDDSTLTTLTTRTVVKAPEECPDCQTPLVNDECLRCRFEDESE